MIIDDIKLDETNAEFNYASEFVLKTDKVVYLTGKAGTGKTTFLKYLRKASPKRTVILAPTGVAAVNAGGQTIHSFFQIRPSVFVPNDKRLRLKAPKEDEDRSTIYNHFQYNKERLELINNLELLIIDEISMVRCDLLDLIDRLLRVFRKKMKLPYGGVQIVLIGDTFQLPPIADRNQWSILSNYYKSPFFFSSNIVKESKPIYIELKKIYRQNEQEFINLLNKVRTNDVSESDLVAINQKYNPSFVPSDKQNYITLATHNSIVDSTNITKLQTLESELKIFEATVTGNFPDRTMPTLRSLQLKVDAQVMFVKNDKSKRYYNGKIGKILSIDGQNIVVELSEDDTIVVERQIWQNLRYLWNESTKTIEEEVLGTFTQYPLKLAWAITVHKSQGLTFENVIADLGGAFTSGQVYVALSRCTSFSGLVLKSRIPRSAIKTDPEVIEFAKNETPSTLITSELNAGKIDFLYKGVISSIESNEPKEAYAKLGKAFKLRNDYYNKDFERLFKYYILLLNRYKANKKILSQECIKNENQITTLETKITDLNYEINNLNERISAQSERTNIVKRNLQESQNSNLQLENKLTEANNKLGEHTNSITNLEQDVSKKEVKIKKLKKSNKKRKEEITNFETMIDVLKKEKEDLNSEIDRLRNVKWHEKLLGKK